VIRCTALCTAGALAALLLAAPSAMRVTAAQEFDFDFDKPAPPKLTGIELGVQVYRPELGNCQLCHGWNGNGGRQFEDLAGRTYDPGPPLTESTMTREEMIEIIACGKLGTSIMPQYLENAWKPEHPCWGKTAAEVPDGERAGLWGAPLYLDEIEAVVLWIQTAYQGKQMSLEHCLLYFGPESRGCDTLRK